MHEPGLSLLQPPGTAVLKQAAGVRLLVLDVDGVLTDGTIWYGEQGEVLKAFNSLDGMGLSLLRQEGIPVALLSARDSVPLRRRAAELGIKHLSLGRHDKREAFDALVREAGVDTAEAAYAGDDLIDLPVLRHAGLAITVPNGHPALRPHCHWCTTRGGGSGAVREICELLLAARGRLEAVIAEYAR